MDTIRPTRFKELGYRQDGPDLWRIYDLESNAAVGYHYKSKAELMGDLDRYAAEFGCEEAAFVETAEHQIIDFLVEWYRGSRRDGNRKQITMVWDVLATADDETTFEDLVKRVAQKRDGLK